MTTPRELAAAARAMADDTAPIRLTHEFVVPRMPPETVALLTELAGAITEFEKARLQIEAKLRGHRGSSTRGPRGQYKNPAREGYDRGLTEALALLGVDAKEKNE